MKYKILVVEDELLIANDIKQILEPEGYEVFIGITTVQEAVSYIENFEFHMVLIDVNLQNNSDGVELGSFLLQKETIPYIYLTSYSDNITLERIKASRPFGMIVKPYKPLDIKTTISIVLNNFIHNWIDVKRFQSDIIEDVPYILKDVIRYVDTNIDDSINLSDLSIFTPWSNQHFIRVFAKYVGCTPYKYILKKKIQKSKAIISDTDLPLKDIAFDLGFSSYGNFCNLFKKELGIKPDEYRKLQNIIKHNNKIDFKNTR